MTTYELKIKGLQEDLSSGTLKTAGKKYIVTDGISCGHSEGKAFEHAAKYFKGDISCLSIQSKNIADIFEKDADRLWYVKIQVNIFDPLTGKESKEHQLYLVGAESAKNASEVLSSKVEMMDDYEIVKISDSKVDFVISAI